jgi:hypothetical protein
MMKFNALNPSNILVSLMNLCEVEKAMNNSFFPSLCSLLKFELVISNKSIKEF